MQNYHELTLPSDQSLTEFSLQEENGVLDVLRDSFHYTYSFFPSDYVKQEVPLKVWQRPTYNWKLECENAPDKALAAAITELQTSETAKPWV